MKLLTNHHIHPNCRPLARGNPIVLALIVSGSAHVNSETFDDLATAVLAQRLIPVPSPLEKGGFV
jgi:hypothetical protein